MLLFYRRDVQTLIVPLPLPVFALKLEWEGEEDLLVMGVFPVRLFKGWSLT